MDFSAHSSDMRALRRKTKRWLRGTSATRAALSSGELEVAALDR
jgi:hypothetical protein